MKSLDVSMICFDKQEEVKRLLNEHKGDKIGFVPTMGALHEGHISLVKQAHEKCDFVVVSIFVNPTQFNDPNDLKNYPRDLDKDLAMLQSEGVDLVYVPAAEDIYPEPDNRIFDFRGLDKVMEGATRPGHFNGVAQVVSKLFDIIRPERVYFGEKDFQQIAIIREMARQLKYTDIEIVSCPTVREVDGLAMSSRNQLLDKDVRNEAPKIYHAMRNAVSKRSEITPAEIEGYVKQKIEHDGVMKVIYFTIFDAETLVPIENWNETTNPHACIAVQAGGVRLIDNISFA